MLFRSDLDPSSTYYLKAFARSKITNTPSIWTGSPIIINTYTTIANGAYAGGYYINSQLTTLSLNGTGEWNGSYYINGQITELVYSEDLGWSGLYQDRFYDHGQPSNGFVSGYWWYEGYQTSELFANHGNGMYQGLFFQNYVPYTGYYDGVWYVAGRVKPELNYNGDGYSGSVYYAGGKPFTGLSASGTYYIDGMATTLASNGSGTWNNQYYSGGAYIGSVGNPYDFGSGMGSTFNAGLTYG